MSNIKLHKPIQGFIVQKQVNQVIQKGSLIFCGNCGGKMGRMKSALKFPFAFSALEKELDDGSIFVTTAGVTHVPCNHFVSFSGADLRFTNLNQYNEWFAEEQAK